MDQKWTPTPEEIQSAMTLADPERVFVLWLIGAGVANTVEDLDRQIEGGFPTSSLVDGLVEEGFLAKNGDEIQLTECAAFVLDALKFKSPWMGDEKPLG